MPKAKPFLLSSWDLDAEQVEQGLFLDVRLRFAQFASSQACQPPRSAPSQGRALTRLDNDPIHRVGLGWSAPQRWE